MEPKQSSKRDSIEIAADVAARIRSMRGRTILEMADEAGVRVQVHEVDDARARDRRWFIDRDTVILLVDATHHHDDAEARRGFAYGLAAILMSREGARVDGTLWHIYGAEGATLPRKARASERGRWTGLRDAARARLAQVPAEDQWLREMMALVLLHREAA